MQNPFQLLLDEIQALRQQIQLLQGKQTSAPPPTEEVFLTQLEVADLLGVSTVTIWAWTKKGLLKSYKIGRLNRYKKSEILASPKRINH